MKKLLLVTLFLSTGLIGMEEGATLQAGGQDFPLATLPADVQFEIVMQMIDNIHNKESLAKVCKSIALLKETSRKFAGLLDDQARRKALLKKLGERAQNFTDLFNAIRDNNVLLVDALITAGADVNALFPNGTTPLHHAAALNAKEIVEILLKNGADAEYAGEFIMTPLHAAAFHNAKDVLALFIKNGANINLSDERGATPLHHAASRNRIESAKFLIENGADVSIRDKFNRKPDNYAPTAEMQYLLEEAMEKQKQSARN